jgi:hypothetical protein
MLVYFQFRRCGYYANGLIEAENLDTAGKALWSEHVKTFRWTKENFISEDANTLTVEVYRDEQHSDKQTEPQAKSGSPVG